MEFKARDSSVNARLKMQHEDEFKMPPIGVVVTRYALGGVNYERWSVRCDTPHCWFMGGALQSKQAAEEYLADHKANGRNFTVPCPAPPRRESLPSGLTYVQKLWRELDEVMEALSDNFGYRDFTNEQTKGYAKGLAFAVVMLEPVHFKNIGDVSRHVRDRRKMRLGEMDWAPTPTLHSATILAKEAGEWTESADQPKPRSKPAAKPVAVDPGVAMAVKAGVGSGMFTVEELSLTYSLSVETVRKIIVDNL